VGALEQLRIWQVYQEHWCEHKPSCTVYYTQDEFLDVCSWVWQNFNDVSGVSFLPLSEHSYQQAPYQEITEEQYDELANVQPSFDALAASAFESGHDSTTGSQELACAAGNCELP
jgi:ribonucleoside-diphosphate reductase alpha chain